MCTFEQRQTYLELTAFAQTIAARFYGALVKLDEQLNERQADAKPAASALERAIRLCEQVPDMGQHVGADTDAFVLHFYYYVIALMHRVKLHYAAAIRIFDGVIEQIGEYLRQPDGISVEHQFVARQSQQEFL